MTAVEKYIGGGECLIEIAYISPQCHTRKLFFNFSENMLQNLAINSIKINCGFLPEWNESKFNTSTSDWQQCSRMYAIRFGLFSNYSQCEWLWLILSWVFHNIIHFITLMKRIPRPIGTLLLRASVNWCVKHTHNRSDQTLPLYAFEGKQNRAHLSSCSQRKGWVPPLWQQLVFPIWEARHKLASAPVRVRKIKYYR